MRLIGGHDYYDGAGMGVDTSVVFVRDPARHLADLPLRTDHPFRVPERSVYGDGAERTELIPTLILIGGERVPGLEERVTEAWVMSARFHYDLAASYEGRSASRLAWFVGAGVELKDARLTTARYFAWRMSGALEMPLGDKGVYARISSSLRFVDFKTDAASLPRKDTRLFNRLAIGAPLGIDGLYLEGAGTYAYRDYNVASQLRDYRSFGGDLRLIWHFGSGR